MKRANKIITLWSLTPLDIPEVVFLSTDAQLDLPIFPTVHSPPFSIHRVLLFFMPALLEGRENLEDLYLAQTKVVSLFEPAYKDDEPFMEAIHLPGWSALMHYAKQS